MVENIWYMGGSQNYGPFSGIHIEGDIDIDVDLDTDSKGSLSKFWSPFGSPKY